MTPSVPKPTHIWPFPSPRLHLPTPTGWHDSIFVDVDAAFVSAWTTFPGQNASAIAAALATLCESLMMLATLGQNQVTHRIKSAPDDVVTEMDIGIEILLRMWIGMHFPTDAIIGEESPPSDSVTTPYLWIIDPIDGTSNYASGDPNVVIQLCRLHNGKPTVAVLAFPFYDLVVAEPGNIQLGVDTLPVPPAIRCLSTEYRDDRETEATAFARMYQDRAAAPYRLKSIGVTVYTLRNHLDFLFYKPRIKLWDIYPPAALLFLQNAPLAFTLSPPATSFDSAHEQAKPLFDTVPSVLHQAGDGRIGDVFIYNRPAHVPIMVSEILTLLDIAPTSRVFDGTGGYGGHSEAILATLGPEGRLDIADRDPIAIGHLKRTFHDPRVRVVHGTFSTVLATGQSCYQRLLLDLGMSSMQLDDPDRGFGYLHDGPLDMRMDPSTGHSAATLLNTASAQTLSDIFFRYGELHQNKILVQNILAARKRGPITDTATLRTLIKQSYNFGNKRPVMMRHFAQVFQALRIAVNQEFDELTQFMTQLPAHTDIGTRVAFLTFHSTEDRLVKHGMKALPAFRMIHPHVILASQTEIQKNSRAKAAKLRVYERTRQ